jgi:hypothetical protein
MGPAGALSDVAGLPARKGDEGIFEKSGGSGVSDVAGLICQRCSRLLRLAIE